MIEFRPRHSLQKTFAYSVVLIVVMVVGLIGCAILSKAVPANDVVRVLVGILNTIWVILGGAGVIMLGAALYELWVGRHD